MMIMNSDDAKGVVLVRYEDGTPKCFAKKIGEKL
jgi:hypothetical protein